LKKSPPGTFDFGFKDCNSMKKILSIAGSDSSGGAGIQADIKTITAHNMYAMTAITALTAQNTTGVRMIANTSPEMVEAQLDMIFEDIRPDAVKTGMLSGCAIIAAVAQRLKHWQAQNIVVDPVMVSTSGCALISPDACEVLKEKLLPLAAVLTPNMPEAEKLVGHAVSSRSDMEQAGHEIANQYGCAVLIKGGHRLDDAADVLVAPDGGIRWFEGTRIDTDNTHGTGCTLSSAIACALADGLPLGDAVAQAKEYVRGALSTGLDLGKGSGPLNHVWRSTGKITR